MSSSETDGPADDLVVGFDRLHVGQVEQRVEQHRGVAGGEDEAVAVGPDRVGGVEAQEALPERVGDRGHRHRRPRVPRVGLLDRVDRQRADRVDAELVDVLRHWRDDPIESRGPQGSIRVTVAVAVVGDPDRVAADRDGARVGGRPRSGRRPFRRCRCRSG